ncbi:biotin-independent malonate decarboxylase subunit gamma [Marinobacterium sedimentorum]|uniref:biotin-independent malonate decarboxylase subunit gamma n=1 Tax=Marinobacterium sedimentorum TaxID=2927804 RepID=UPI0020C65F39|nr:biotin-independent malonate decarboxylase subunit gamma [Marinobacterium sedimentorum]MCP8688397.1 biotin-independent malonate decarboxylase subunit gamma [Marinobacterium sedimentorum]
MNPMSTDTQTSGPSQRGRTWFDALTAGMTAQANAVPSVRSADGELAGRPCRIVLVQPDPGNRYPRARSGEVGLLEGWALASTINEVIRADAQQGIKRAIVAIVDVPSQAYGRREEALGIHQALAAAVSAYARARQAGHPVLALLVGKAMSGAFLAHGYQANFIFALNDEAVLVHAMGKAAAARVTQRTEEELDRLAADIPPMAYDLQSYASLGLVEKLIDVTCADAPAPEDIQSVRQILADALGALNGSTDLARRLLGPNRAASRHVRARLREQWHNEADA